MHKIPCPLQTWAGAKPDAPAIVMTTNSISYKELDERVHCCMYHLAANGIKSDDRVAIVLPTSIDFIAMIWALYRLGAIACPINPLIPESRKIEMALDADCTFWIGVASSFSTRVPDKCQFLELEKISMQIKEFPSDSLITIDRDKACTLVFTSGSTGRAKGAILSFRNLQVSALRSNRNLPLLPEDTWLLSLPLYHVSGLGILFRCIMAGASIGLLKLDESIDTALDSMNITHLSLVAVQLHRLLTTSGNISRLRKLHGILLGGSAIPPSLLYRAVETALPVHTTYGLTEMASQVTTTPQNAGLMMLRRSGRSLHPESLRIASNGEILVTGETLFLGYLQGAGIVQSVDAEGYFHTGDLGYLDEEGYLHVTGRLDNRFISGGENIQPEEIESVLSHIPEVLESVVVPIPHEAFGHRPVAFVRLKKDQKLDLEYINTALAVELPKFKIPQYYFPWPPHVYDTNIKISRHWFIKEAQRLLQQQQTAQQQ